MNPQNDDLASAWMGGGNNPKPPRHPDDGQPAIPYTEQDDTYWRIVDLYGEQEEAKVRMRRGRRIG